MRLLCAHKKKRPINQRRATQYRAFPPAHKCRRRRRRPPPLLFIPAAAFPLKVRVIAAARSSPSRKLARLEGMTVTAGSSTCNLTSARDPLPHPRQKSVRHRRRRRLLLLRLSSRVSLAISLHTTHNAYFVCAEYAARARSDGGAGSEDHSI